MPIDASVGTVQLTSTLPSEYGPSAGRFPLIVAPSGVVISISVAGEVNTPLF